MGVLKMSGKKGMKHYGAEILEDVKAMRAAGKTHREIAEHYEFKDKFVIKGLLRRDRKKEARISAGIIPKQKGRPRKDQPTTEHEKDNEIKRLQMENDLLRSFLQGVGRR
jgi:hypothetical protein